MQPFKILVVDDFALFRRSVHFLLKPRPDFQIVGEASNGVEAVQQAAELKPDLILLDATLPKKNGIEAAREIRDLAPDSKIVFMHYESGSNFVQETSSLGAAGYVLKTAAEKDLLKAVETVYNGGRFCSPNLADRVRVDVNSNAHFHFEFDTDNRIFLASFHGPATSETMKEFYHACAAAAMLAQDFRGSIADFSKISRIRVTPHAIRELAALPPADRVLTRPRVVVAPNAGMFALARLFQSLGRATRPNLHVVRTLDHAFAWLKMSEPRFDPIFPWIFESESESGRLARA